MKLNKSQLNFVTKSGLELNYNLLIPPFLLHCLACKDPHAEEAAANMQRGYDSKDGSGNDLH